MTRSDIGQALATHLYSAETAIDSALTEAARLAAFLPQARADAYLSAVAGQKAFEGAGQTVAALSEARGHMVRTHNALSALARSLGVDVQAVGPVDKPEDSPPMGGGGVQGESEAANSLFRGKEIC